MISYFSIFFLSILLHPCICMVVFGSIDEGNEFNVK